MSATKDMKILKQFISGCIPSPPDDRDYTVDTVSLTVSSLPKTFIATGMKVLNQGNIGSCVAHACATAMGYGELRGGATNAHDFSRGFIYGNRSILDHQGEGMCIRQALKRLNHDGSCQYYDFPYNETYPAVKNRIEQDKNNLMTKAEPFKIVNYFRCYTDDEVKTALIHQGAVVISIPVYSSFSADCPIPASDDVYKGGHAMCVVGWDETGWIVQNSWSKSWGKKGTLHLPYEYPINEFWGITVNSNVPAPVKRKWWEELVAFIKFIIRKISKIQQ